MTSVWRLAIAVAAIATLVFAQPAAFADASPTPRPGAPATQPASPARTNPGPTITLYPDSGTLGTVVIVGGSGFLPNSAIFINIDRLVLNNGSAMGQPDLLGQFAIPVLIDGLVAGAHAICAVSSAGGEGGCAQFVVTGPLPTVTLSISEGLPGAQFTVKGSGFPPFETIRLYFDDDITTGGVPRYGCGVPGWPLDAKGAFTANCEIPYSTSGYPTPGRHKLCGDTNVVRNEIRVIACAPIVFLAGPTASPSLAPSAIPPSTPRPVAAARLSGVAAVLGESLVALGLALLIGLAYLAVRLIRRRRRPHPPTKGEDGPVP
jgi:hypothetical protein